MDPIYITKSFLPPLEEYVEKIKSCWNNHLLTNDGPLFQEFEQELRNFTRVQNLVALGNGTLALQIAIRALDIKGEVITTPFTHVATSGSLVWENCKPLYVDIDPETLNLDVLKIEEKITKNTSAILAVHVYSNPCDIAAIKAIADKHSLKVIYDGAHAFGVNYKGKSIFSYGDISMASFNATKAFHTIEGGALFVKNAEMVDLVRRLAYFGLDKNKIIVQKYGMNAKLNELCAAMGIVNLKYLPEAQIHRKNIYGLYIDYLKENSDIGFQKINEEINHSYMPIILASQQYKDRIIGALNKDNIYPREYFHPSLETKFDDEINCPISLDISNRVLCLPISDYTEEKQVERICSIINGC